MTIFATWSAGIALALLIVGIGAVVWARVTFEPDYAYAGAIFVGASITALILAVAGWALS